MARPKDWNDRFVRFKFRHGQTNDRRLRIFEKFAKSC